MNWSVGKLQVQKLAFFKVLRRPQKLTKSSPSITYVGIQAKLEQKVQDGF